MVDGDKGDEQLPKSEIPVPKANGPTMRFSAGSGRIRLGSAEVAGQWQNVYTFLRFSIF